MNQAQGIAMTGMNTRNAYDLDLRHVRGLVGGRRALEIAAAGRHHLLTINTWGGAKSLDI